MQRWRISSLGLFFAITMSFSVSGQSPETANNLRFDALLSKLQSDRYEEREEASAEILELGTAIRPWVVRGAQGPTLELRLRCERLLRRMENSAFVQQVADFRAGRVDKARVNLPCWGEFRSLFGGESKVRELYCDIAISERGLLSLLDEYQRTAREMDAKVPEAERRARLTLKARPIQTALEELSTSPLFQVPSNPWDARSLGRSGARISHRVETLCVCILIGNDQKLREHKAISEAVFGLIRDSANVRALRKSPHFPIVRVGAARWLSRSEVKVQPLSIAMQLGLSDVALDLGRKAVDACANDQVVAPDDTRHAMMTGTTLGIIACGRFGDETDIDRLARLMDKNVVIQTWITVDQKTSTGQLRDLALAYSAHLAGMNAKELGFPLLETNSETVYAPYTITFIDDAQREAAHKEWTRWRGQKPQKFKPSPRQQPGKLDSAPPGKSG